MIIEFIGNFCIFLFLLILLIFFLLTSSFSLPAAIQVALPALSADAEPPSDSLMIQIRADGAFIVDGDSLSAEELAARVEAAAESPSDLKVVVSADRSAQVHHLADCLSTLHARGVENVTFLGVAENPKGRTQ